MTLFARLKRIARTHGPRLFERDAPAGAPFDEAPDDDAPFDEADRRAYDAHRERRRRHTASAHRERERRDPELARYYANLEVPYGADLRTVHAAYRRLMKRYHPDRHADSPERRRLARQITQGLNEAYHALRHELNRQR